MALIDCSSLLFHWSIVFVLMTLIMHQNERMIFVGATDKLSNTIHSFIYNNERLCGDPFANPMWLPAHHKCEMECDMLTEMCQESVQKAAIKAQRCVQLSKRCVNALYNELYGSNREEDNSNDELDDKSIENEINEFQKASDQPVYPRKGVSISGTTGEQSSYNDDQRPLKPFGLDVRLIKASGVSNFRLQTSTSKHKESGENSSEEPFSTHEFFKNFDVSEKSAKKPIESKDESLFNEILHTSTTSFIQSKLGNDNEEKHQNGSPMQMNKSFIDTFFEETFADLNTLTISNSQNNRQPEISITIPPSPTLPYTTPRTTTNSFVTAAATDEQSTFLTSNNILEMTSNPFETMVAQAVGPISQQWVPSAHYKEIDNRLEVPPEVPTMSPEVHIFGPPFLSRSSTPSFMTMPLLSSTEHQRAAPLNYKAHDNSVSTNFETDKTFSANHYFPLSWRELANRLKKKPFYSLDDRQEVDQSPNCCQFALEGLCDRSHQRVRAMCPKSCGSVVCSSVDGSLSCNRAINVDVIDCYERRRYKSFGLTSNQRLHQSSAPIRKISEPNEDSSSHENKWLEQQKHADEKPAQLAKAPQSQASMLKRAFAIEDEIKEFRSLHNSIKKISI